MHLLGIQNTENDMHHTDYKLIQDTEYSLIQDTE